MGSSLLALFVAGGVPLGFWTIVIAHVMFCVSFVVVTVKARLAGLDPRLEEAAMDLYANEWQTFRRVTLPLVLPGIVAAALLAFSLSFDDFIITNFNSGTTVTFPMFVWGATQRGIPPQVNVIGTAMFVIALARWSLASNVPAAAGGADGMSRRHDGARRGGRALADACPRPFWLDRPERPDPLPAADRRDHADLLVVGGGYSGLWTALLAKERDPAGTSCCSRPAPAAGPPPAATAGSARRPDPRARQRRRPLPRRDRRRWSALGRENLDAIERHRGRVRHRLRLRAHRRARRSPPSRTRSTDLAESAALARGPRPRRSTLLDRDEVRAEVDSPTYLGGLWDQRPGRHGRPGPARLGPAPRLPRARRADLRAHPR